MKQTKPRKTPAEMRTAVICSAAKLFLAKGYTAATLREIAAAAEVNIGSLLNIFDSKEDILCELVRFSLDKQFEKTEKIIEGITEDKMFFYATETVLQLHIAEMSEQLRDLFLAAYSMPKTSRIIQHTLTEKLEDIFKEHLPYLETKDFYKLEIASGGVMRGFMTVPCDMWFTMDQKVESFLETTFLIYEVPKPKIRAAIEFVKQFDFNTFAEQIVKEQLGFLEGRADSNADIKEEIV